MSEQFGSVKPIVKTLGDLWCNGGRDRKAWSFKYQFKDLKKRLGGKEHKVLEKERTEGGYEWKKKNRKYASYESFGVLA